MRCARFARHGTKSAAARLSQPFWLAGRGTASTPPLDPAHSATVAPHSDRMAAFDLNAHSLADNSNKVPKTWSHPVPHSLWSPEVLENVEITHKPPKGFVDRTARFTCWWLRFWFDIFAGFKFGKVTEKKFINRLVFLETVAGVPGMVAGMVRHLHSLRRLKRDNGWIHTLLEEAENERMHLLTFMEMKKPGLIFRLALLVSQGVFFNFFFVAYLISPLYCHRLVGYIEEEAVRTYTKLLHEVEAGNLFKNTACPPIAVAYWRLGEKATFRDLVLAVRADEAGHRLANHTFADMHQAHHGDHPNPFVAMTPANTNAVHHDSKKDGKDPC